MARLRPFVTALPVITPINVNTATPEVLAAVVDGLQLNQASTIVARRESAIFRTVEDFLHHLPKELVRPSEGLSVGSTYFLASMRVTVGESQARGTALLAREGTGWPIVMWRKYP